MPRLRTDDGPRRLRAVWLGPRGTRFPFEWSYVQWIVFVGLYALCGLAVFVLVFSFDPLMAWLSGPTWGLALAYAVTRWVMSRTDYDRPLRYWRTVLGSEWRHSRRVPVERVARLRAPEVRELPRQAHQVLYTAPRSGPVALSIPRGGDEQ